MSRGSSPALQSSFQLVLQSSSRTSFELCTPPEDVPLMSMLSFSRVWLKARPIVRAGPRIWRARVSSLSFWGPPRNRPASRSCSSQSIFASPMPFCQSESLSASVSKHSSNSDNHDISRWACLAPPAPFQSDVSLRLVRCTRSSTGQGLSQVKKGYHPIIKRMRLCVLAVLGVTPTHQGFARRGFR